jgi:integration host factor subunit beta
MIQSDLVWRIWRQSPHLQRQEVQATIHAIFDEITATLARGDRIELRGFGAFLSRFATLALAVIPRLACS